jgi:hypothetical protein
MPTGIILKSASHEVSDEVREKNLQAVVERAGYEVAEKPEVTAEPKREDFKTEEEFEAAHVGWQDKQEAKPAAAAGEEEEEVAPPRKSRKTRAIERATAELKRENEELRKKLEESGKTVTPKTEEAPKEAARPKRADFEQGDDGQQKYEDALIAWGLDKGIKDKAVKDAQAADQARFNENLLSYKAQVEEAKDTYEDWDDVVNQDIHIGREVQLAILEQENGAEVVYYLGRHPAYARKLGELSPLSAVMEVGRLSARLKTGAPAPGEAHSEEPTKPKPKVPAPVRTVSTAGSSAALTFAEIAAKPSYPGKARDLRAAQAAER